MPGTRLILCCAMARVSAGDTRGEPRNVTVRNDDQDDDDDDDDDDENEIRVRNERKSTERR